MIYFFIYYPQQIQLLDRIKMTMNKKNKGDLLVREMKSDDLPAVKNIISLAFGTFLNAENPADFWKDLDYSKRYLSKHSAGFVIEMDNEILGSNFATRLGSFGFFGPITVHPKIQNKGAGQLLMDPIVNAFKSWGITHSGLFTFPESPMHIHLYQKYDFWPKQLVPLMYKPIVPTEKTDRLIEYSSLNPEEAEKYILETEAICDRIYDGLRVKAEINFCKDHNLGETLFEVHENKVVAFAICHFGEGTEGGKEKCLLKIGIVDPNNSDKKKVFSELITKVEAFADSKGILTMEIGVNTKCHNAYRELDRMGYKSMIHGVSMVKGNSEGFFNADCYMLHDWR